MKVLVIGSGGREHALCWKIARSPLVTEVFCAPGNPGTAEVATNISGGYVEAALSAGVDFVVVGPDGDLAAGAVDQITTAGIPAFGPTQDAARLESSKIFCKSLLLKYGIPTAKAAYFEDAEAARAYLQSQPEGPQVVKADGLAVGKGVVVAASRQEAIDAVDEVLGIASTTVKDGSNRVLIEEMMTGEEVSLFALADGENILPLIDVQDHKRVGEGDTGPNTGGMGCYSPVPSFTPELREQVIRTILEPTMAGLRAEGVEYRGVLYCGIMLTPQGPKVVEYNARFGDPECQIIMPRLKSDVMPLLLASAGMPGYNLQDQSPEWTNEAAVCVIMASAGYPGAYRKGDAITGLETAKAEGALVFQAGTKLGNEGIITSGGRVLGVTALGPDFTAARAKSYAAVEKIRFEGAHYRRDIGWRAVAD